MDVLLGRRSEGNEVIVTTLERGDRPAAYCRGLRSPLRFTVEHRGRHIPQRVIGSGWAPFDPENRVRAVARILYEGRLAATGRRWHKQKPECWCCARVRRSFRSKRRRRNHVQARPWAIDCRRAPPIASRSSSLQASQTQHSSMVEARQDRPW